MKNPTQKSIQNLSIAILAISGLTLVYIYVQMVSLLWLDKINHDGTERINKGLKDGEFFPASNLPILRWAALVSAFLAFAHSNYDAVVKGESEFSLDSNTILVPLVVLLFAGLYKLAHLTAKDSSLAI